MVLSNNVNRITYNDIFLPSPWTTQPIEIHTYVEVSRSFTPTSHYDVSIDAYIDGKHTFTSTFAYEWIFSTSRPPSQQTVQCGPLSYKLVENPLTSLHCK